MKKQTIIALTAIVAVLAAAIFAGCVEKEAPISTPTSSIIAVTARELCSAYEANELAADAEYDGKIVKVSGVVDSIGKDIIGTPYITLECGKLWDGVQCMFDKKYEPQLAQLAKGERVTVQGRCDGHFMGAVLIIDCILE